MHFPMFPSSHLPIVSTCSKNGVRMCGTFWCELTVSEKKMEPIIIFAPIVYQTLTLISRNGMLFLNMGLPADRYLSLWGFTLPLRWNLASLLNRINVQLIYPACIPWHYQFKEIQCSWRRYAHWPCKSKQRFSWRCHQSCTNFVQFLLS
jgi:hypothetical protein